MIDLHNALIKICVLSDQMRQNRLNLIADMIEQLELAGVIFEPPKEGQKQ